MKTVQKLVEHVVAFIRYFHIQDYAQMQIGVDYSIDACPWKRIAIGIPTFINANCFSYNITARQIPENSTSFKFVNVPKNDGNYIASGKVDYVIIFIPYF